MASKEMWTPIAGYKDLYEVSNCGRVRRIAGGHGTRAGRLAKLTTRRDGYQVVNLSRNGKRKTFTVHRLVAAAFLDNCDGVSFVNHKDFDRANNHISNLEYVTPCGNIHHAIDAGRMPFKKKRPGKLQWDQVCQIRELRTQGWLIVKIAARFGMDQSTVSNIVNNKTRLEDLR
jgi:hypothetical protein